MKKTISMDDKVVNKAIKRADELGMTFSGYLTYLINRDLGEIAVTKDKKRE